MHRTTARLLLTCTVTIVAASLVVAAPRAVRAGASSPAQRDVVARLLGPGNHTLTMNVEGLSRSLLLHVPPGAAKPDRPLLLVFHGHTDTAQSTAQGTDFEYESDRTGDVVAFLQGVDDAWNDLAHPDSPRQPNDVAFASTAISVLENHVKFDHARVVAVGFSNGALMVEELGCKLASRLQMIVPVEGQLAVLQSQHCAPARPLWVYEVHGTADTALPYGGGESHGFDELSAPRSVARWAQLDHCAKAPSHRSPSRSVRLTTYASCRHHVTVVLRTLVGGQHAWPSNIAVVVHDALPH